MTIKTDVLIIGGGFAGVSVAQALEKQGIQTTLVDRKDYFEVTFATLRNTTAPQITKNQARKNYKDFLSGRFIQNSVINMTNNTVHLSDGVEITFEQGIIASGTRYPSMPMAKTDTAIDIHSRNQELLNYHKQLKSANKIMVIGGGVVGVELAGEIAYAMPKAQVSLAHNSDVLLNGFKEKAQKKAQQQLEDLGVNIIFNSRYQQKDGRYVNRNSGIASDADLVFEATGVLPNNDFLKPNMAKILNEQGFVSVNEHLEVLDYKNLYALGDIADIGEAKLGYLAQEQGNYVAKSIIKKRKGKPSKAYKRNPLMALIPVGQKRGVVQLPFAVTTLKQLVNLKQKDLFIGKIYKAFGTSPNTQ